METVQAEVGDVVSNSTDRMIVEDVFEEPSFSVGDLVMIVKDTTPGVDPSFSYDKEGRITMVMSDKETHPNEFVLKLLHELSSEEATDLWSIPIDYSGIMKKSWKFARSGPSQ